MGRHLPEIAVVFLLLAAAGCPAEPRLPVCGNGVVEGRELCDDGNLEPGDGCDENCLIEGRELCDNGEDDDGDGSADCADPDCFNNPICDGVEICTNGFNDDGDELVDCDDEDCFDADECREVEDCTNGIDDDRDELVDCDDVSDCQGHPACGGCDPEIDLGAMGPGDDRTLVTETGDAANPAGISCAGAPRGAHLRFTAPVGFHLRISAAPVSGQHVLGLLKEEEPGITCETDELRCVAVDANPTFLEWTGLAPGAYRLVVAPAAPESTGQLQLHLVLLPGAQEICGNEVDDDNDGLTDCDDPDCAQVPECLREDCENGVDDDNDSLVDCDDPDCAQQPPCLPPEACGNGLDDDGDGLVDCADVDCTATATCLGSDCVVNVDLGVLGRGAVVQGDFDTALALDDNQTSCADPGAGPDVVFAFSLPSPANVRVSMEQTGDHVLALSGEAGPGSWCDDAEMVCVDPGGTGRSVRTTFAGLPAARYFLVVDAVAGDRTGIGSVQVEVFDPLLELCDDGLDDDGDALVDCDDPDCLQDPVCLPETLCHDDLDNDADGWTDCADFDCVGTSACSSGSCTPDRELGVVLPGMPALAQLSTVDAPDVHQTSCARLGGGGDVVLGFTTVTGGDVVVNATQHGFSDHALALTLPGGPGAPCDAAEHACVDGGAPGLPIATVIPAVPAGRYYLLIEPYGPGGAGSLTVQVSGEPP